MAIQNKIDNYSLMKNGNINSGANPNYGNFYFNQSQNRNINSVFDANFGNFYFEQNQNGNNNMNQHNYTKNSSNYTYQSNNNNMGYGNRRKTNGNNISTTHNQAGIRCHRCEQFGHKAFICPYSMDEIKEMKRNTNKMNEAINKNVNDSSNTSKPLNSK
ncbi:hypothetical protein PIROE2DRAFT_65120 [Piromyces sp. E2]|nr:hypothetical protein PIROE2DRAFT_65120 [Piromyces sp. E2]|eukprot:OUM57231.1 hypothetical protein PIROE2DRAFT_65120 [Piromyces sp. E2]